MQELKQKVEEFQQNTPENLEDFSDIYFKWSREAAEMADLNPEVTKGIHAGLEEDAEVAGLEETAEIYDRMTDDKTDIYLADDESNISGREPLMMVEGPAQQLFEPETVGLGSLSYHLTEANEELGYSHPDPVEYGEGAAEIVEMLDDLSEEVGQKIGLADFGARHYHPAQQTDLAKEVFKNGVVGHSTQKGVEAINEAYDKELEAGGTMNHAFVLAHAAEYGLENATLEAVKTYDNFFEDSPTPVLVDTNNAERDDTLEVCNYMEEKHGEDFELTLRMDTNGANYAQTVPENQKNPENKGMSVEAVKGMSETLRENNYRDNITFLISSGMGKPEKLRDFVNEAETYHDDTGYAMFDGVGAGSFTGYDNLHTTSDIVEADGKPLGKVGRLEELQETVGGDFKAYRDENMELYKPKENYVEPV